MEFLRASGSALMKTTYVEQHIISGKRQDIDGELQEGLFDNQLLGGCEKRLSASGILLFFEGCSSFRGECGAWCTSGRKIGRRREWIVHGDGRPERRCTVRND